MRYRLLGKTGLFVSELALGTNTFGGSGARWEAFGALGREDAGRIVGLAADRGINLVDTADSYAEGEAESRVGMAIKDLKLARSSLLVLTKGYQRNGKGPNDVGLSRGHLMDALDASLKRLGTDYVDIYLLHTFDPLTPLEETMRALDLMVRQGKVRYVGCSNFAGWQIAAAQGAAREIGCPRLELVEAMYTITARDIEREVIPASQHYGMGLMVWGALGAGLLTGKYRRNTADPAGTRLSSGGSTIADREKALDAVEAMDPIAKAKGISIANVAISWVLHQAAVSSVVVGCRTAEQLEANLGALAVAFSDEELKTLGSIGTLRPEYPATMQRAMSTRRLPS